MATQLMPISNPNQLLNEEGVILNPLYMKGAPRSYHLNLSEACLKLEGKKQVTDPEKPFKVVPVAVRVLEGALFGNEEKKWCEFYFINEAGHLCVFMFHSFSLDNFRNKFRELFYEQVSPCEVVWEIKYSKKAKQVDGRNQTYYIAEFEFEALKTEQATIMQGALQNILSKSHHIYRDDTRNFNTLFFKNWSDGKTLTKAETKEEEDRQKGLEAEFQTKAEKAKTAKTKTMPTQKTPKTKAA